MPSWPTLLTPLRHSLAGHLGRLGRSFEGLAGQVREALARSVGRTVAEAVQAALAVSSADPDLPPPVLGPPPAPVGRGGRSGVARRRRLPARPPPAARPVRPRR
jgi:hypothetical protein